MNRRTSRAALLIGSTALGDVAFPDKMTMWARASGTNAAARPIVLSSRLLPPT